MNGGGIAIRTWMAKNIEDARDQATDEVNATLLAEAAARRFNEYDGDSPTERLFEWAAELVDHDDRKRAGTVGGGLRGLINALESDWF